MRLMEAESLLKESSWILSSESPRSEFGQLMTAAEESMGHGPASHVNCIHHKYVSSRHLTTIIKNLKSKLSALLK